MLSQFVSGMEIISPKNPLLQELRKAAASGIRTERGLVVAEGPRLIEEALRGSWRVEQIFTTAENRVRYQGLFSRVDAEVVEVSERAINAISATENSQGLLALLRPAEWSWDDLANEAALLVVLDGIQDPGNGGTMIRSAEAFGATGVLLLQGSVHSSNGKFLRATAGSLFRLPFLEHLGADETRAALARLRIATFALMPDGDQSLLETDLTQRCALVVGSEGAGVSQEMLRSAVRVRIPTANVESLNAGVACSVALFEAGRQRRRI